MDKITDEDMELLEKFCLETITEEEHKRLEKRLLESEALRSEARSYMAMDSYLNMDMDLMMGLDFELEGSPQVEPVKPISFVWPIAVAASISFVAGILVIYAIMSSQSGGEIAGVDEVEEVKASGFAVIDKTVDVEWGNKTYLDGQAVGKETLSLKKGIVHLEFFCGASVIIDGPAEFEVRNSWQGFCRKGKLRAIVPPAAHGFKIDTAKTSIVDLGTEFGLEVSDEGESVVVFDGEIELDTPQAKKKLLQAGDGVLVQDGKETVIKPTAAEEFINTTGINKIHQNKQLETYNDWRKKSQQWANDPRLIAYYNFDHEESPYIRNIATLSKANLVGKIIRAERVSGRWKGIENGGAMEFRKPGSRVRVNIPGEYSNFTFSAWVRIDSLNREWNGLFMGDSYQVGEPHWQINEDGGLVICVKVYERNKNWHYLYKSKPIWDPSKSGQWMHLATVYSPTEKRVTHLVNGEVVYNRHIDEEWHVKKLRIGPAEIGNWGQPTRNDPVFALRNINGRIDEMMIFDAALTDKEVKAIYQQGNTLK